MQAALVFALAIAASGRATADSKEVMHALDHEGRPAADPEQPVLVLVEAAAHCREEKKQAKDGVKASTSQGLRTPDGMRRRPPSAT